MEAVFAAAINEPTADRSRATTATTGSVATRRSQPRRSTPTSSRRSSEAGITLADYRVAARGDVLRKKLSDKIVADLSQAGPAAPRARDPPPRAERLGDRRPRPAPRSAGSSFAPKDDMANASRPAGRRSRVGRGQGRGGRRPYAAILKARPHEVRRAGAQRTRTRRTRQGHRRQAALVLPVDRRSTRRSRTRSSTTGLTPGTLLDPIKGAARLVRRSSIMRPTGEARRPGSKALKAKATDDATFKQLAQRQQRGRGREGRRRHRLDRPGPARRPARHGRLRRPRSARCPTSSRSPATATTCSGSSPRRRASSTEEQLDDLREQRLPVLVHAGRRRGRTSTTPSGRPRRRASRDARRPRRRGGRDATASTSPRGSRSSPRSA